MVSKIMVTRIPLHVNRLEYPVDFEPDQVIFVERSWDKNGKAMLKVYWITKEK